MKSLYVNNSPKIIVLDVESILLLISHSLSRKSIEADELLCGDDCSGLRRVAFNSCRGDRHMPILRVVFGSVFEAIVLLLIASTSLCP